MGKSEIRPSDQIVGTITADIDFSNETSKDVTISLGKEITEVLMGRLYIDQDPGAAFSQWCTYTFYNDSDKKGEHAFYRTEAKLVYDELEVATTGSDANITPDDHTNFSPNDLVAILDTSTEWVRLLTVANTMVAEDNIDAHAIDVGLSRVSEFAAVTLFNNESGNDVYLRVKFASAQTVSLKLELLVRS